MKKRMFIASGAVLGAGLLLKNYSWALADKKSDSKSEFEKSQNTNQLKWSKTMGDVKKIELSDDEWRERLSKASYNVLRKEGTERPGSSLLEHEKRKGEFLCAGCGLLLFTSEMKYDSGTGWPSFFDVVEEHIEKKEDRKLFSVRTEYHCKRCGGHQGHVFDDGPRPTGQRWCNNGVALEFVPT